MQVVGTLALDVGRAPGAAVARLAGDLAAALGVRARRAAAWLVYEVVAALRTRGPAVAALLVSGRGALRPTVSGRVPATKLAPRPLRTADEDGSAARHRELVLPADPAAPGRARALLRDAAQEWELDDDVYQDAAMVVTELVANAVDHARTASTVTVDWDERGLCVAVRDARPGPAPEPGPIDAAAPRGRGLQMVDALSVRWGVTPHGDGKTVWAVVGAG
jgi:anti-sigma regulatory factor (Ser/Thr protein kinase)